MRLMKFLLIVITVCIFASCVNQSGDTELEELKIYALRHVEGKSEWIRDKEPLFTGNDIEEYIWGSHIINFNDEFLETKSSIRESEDLLLKGSKILSIYYPDKFSIYLHGKVLYVGHIEPQGFISFYPGGPVLSDNDTGNGIQIECLIEKEDTRYNQELKDFLIQAGLLE